MDAKKLIEAKQERATLTKDIRDLMTEWEGKEMDALAKEKLAKMEARFDELNGKILAEEKQLERERIIGEQLEEKDPQNKKPDDLMMAFKNVLVMGDEESIKIYSALQQSNPTQAGYLVAPEKFVMELIKDMADATFMRQKCKVLPPLQGAQSLGYPTRTAGMNSFAWGTEIQTPTADSTLAFGKREFKPKPGTSLILLSKTLIRNAPESDAIVREEISEETSKNLEQAYMTGSGAGQPLGVFIASNDGIPVSRDVSTGNTATEMKFDGLINAKMSVKQQYRLGAEWIMHRDGIKQIMKLKDSNGQYIWQPSVVAGQPDRILGDPVNESEYAPNTFTTGQYVGLYGNLKRGYWIVDSLAMEIQVLTELYALTNQIGYITRLETDGAPVLPNAFARVKLA
jgi:HK97 family phage major capsid protein